MRKLFPIILLLLLCACESLGGGSSTTQRPALNRPAIGPDGTFWDATVIARQGDREAFRFLLSPQFIHRALFPEEELDDVTTQEEFNEQRESIEANLLPYEMVVQRMSDRYMTYFNSMMTDKFVEVSRPNYDIDYTDEYDRAEGPNHATVTVSIYPKGPTGEDFEPETFKVRFIQDGRRWLIDELTPDPHKGSFTR